MQHNSGQLRHQLIHQTLSETQDTYGQLIQSFVTDTTVPNGTYFGFVKTLNARERVNAAQIREDIDTSITMRYMSGLTTRDRFLFGNYILNVVGIIDEDNRQRWVEVLCVTVTTGGQR